MNCWAHGAADFLGYTLCEYAYDYIDCPRTLPVTNQPHPYEVYHPAFRHLTAMGKAGDWNGDGEVDYRDLFEFSVNWKEDTLLKAADEEGLLHLLKLICLMP